MRSLFLLLSCMLPITAILYSQSSLEELEKINLAYLNQSVLSAEVSFKVFKTHYATKPIQVEVGVIKKSNESYYYKIGPLEMLQTPDFYLMCDHEDESIAIFRIFGESAQLGLGDISASLKALSSQIKEISIVNLSNDLRRCIIHLPEGYSEYKTVYLDYNSKSYLLTNMRFFYAQSQDLTEEGIPTLPRMEITYTKVDTSPRFVNNQFDKSLFLIKSGNKLRLKSTYQNYHLTDHYSLK